MKIKEKQLKNIIRECVKTTLINENNYKNNLNKIRTAAHLAGKDPNQAVQEFLAKQQALADINRERAEQRENEHVPVYDDDTLSVAHWGQDVNRNANDFNHSIKPEDLETIPDLNNDFLDDEEMVNEKKKTIKINESTLRNIIKESLMEIMGTPTTSVNLQQTKFVYSPDTKEVYEDETDVPTNVILLDVIGWGYGESYYDSGDYYTPPEWDSEVTDVDYKIEGAYKLDDEWNCQELPDSEGITKEDDKIIKEYLVHFYEEHNDYWDI